MRTAAHWLDVIRRGLRLRNRASHSARRGNRVRVYYAILQLRRMKSRGKEEAPMK